jgi:hydrogenase maturation protein HypF
MKKRARLNLSGIVQGVGFRPFVYRLAKEYRLNGFVANNEKGVEIEIEGDDRAISHFIDDIKRKKPPLASIERIKVTFLPLNSYRGFEIRESIREGEASTLIPPDIAVCDDCLGELFDPADRRYHYPFINCLNCGPRYTIIESLPYDRQRTVMSVFEMCPDCREEYHDPGNRRFHAQPNACACCGPKVFLVDKEGNELAGDPIVTASLLLKKGSIVAVKGLGGFHLAVDAENEQAVAELRRRKDRPAKPFAVMSPRLSEVRRYALVSEEEEALLASAERPIVLLKKKKESPLSSLISPDSSFIGAMLPYTPLHYLLLSPGFTALVMTSGNLSEEPIVKENEEALSRLIDIADYFLLHDRDIARRTDDSVAGVIDGSPIIVRRSRGYVPGSIRLPLEAGSILAVGGQMKNTICLTRGELAFLSQHLGELETPRTVDFFTDAIEDLKKLLGIKPEAVAYDLHPGYESTRFALSLGGIPRIGVQHHHAHIASVMAEHRLQGPVLGLSLDGTGYGEDGKIWGGELLLVTYDDFKRLGHFRYFGLPGSEKAIKEPYRSGISLLYDAFGEDIYSLPLPVVRDRKESELNLIIEMLKKGINSPLTSSCGRIFDGVAAIIGLKEEISYEAQAAVLLEMVSERVEDGYPFEITGEDDRLIFEIKPIINGVVKDLVSAVPPGVIGGRFHKTLISLFTEALRLARDKTGLNRVALSGGVFQNRIIVSELPRLLSRLGFEVYRNHLVPPNDGGISLGQAAIAAVRRKRCV